MTDFNDLDKAIVDAIRAGKRRFIEIWTAVEHKAESFAKQRDPDRVVDRRLQSLRRRGHIAYKGGRWSASL